MNLEFELETCAITAQAKMMGALDQCCSQMKMIMEAQNALKAYESIRKRSLSLPGRSSIDKYSSESEENEIVDRDPEAINPKAELIGRKSRNLSVPAFKPKTASDFSTRPTGRMTSVTWPCEQKPKSASVSQRSSRRSDATRRISEGLDNNSGKSPIANK